MNRAIVGVPTGGVRQLPPGRHNLTREEVAADQRNRIFRALTSAMAAKGYAATTVADVIKGAGVSRQTFYEQFDSKQECFMASFAMQQQLVVDQISRTPASNSPMQRFATMLETYLGALASRPERARIYLVEVYAAGPEAISRRRVLQEQFVEGIAAIFDAQTPADRFACRALVGAISTLVTTALVDGGPDAVRGLHQPFVELAERMMRVGALNEP
jgi:TetR/AcrR family transcriptional regulator